MKNKKIRNMSCTKEIIKKYVEQGIITDATPRIDWAEVREIAGSIIVVIGIAVLAYLWFSFVSF